MKEPESLPRQLQNNVCAHFLAERCKSCSLMGMAHSKQLILGEQELRELVSSAVPDSEKITWLPPITSPTWGFRTKAKMVVHGSANEPILTLPAGAGGIAQEQIDLCDCPLYSPLLQEVLNSVKAVLKRAQVPPYSVEKQRGEAKFVLVAVSESSALVRFVLRSEQALGRIKEHLRLLDSRVSSIWANIQPQHAAILEGEVDIHLAGEPSLDFPVGKIELKVLPRSFTQTNTQVAAQLYTQVAQWLKEELSGETSAKVWDLYCGVGGFALTAAQHLSASTEVVGVEITEKAVASAQSSARQLGLRNASFFTADAASWAMSQPVSAMPKALIMNPPRRGIGAELAAWVNDSGIQTVIYSSCNPRTLAKDLQTLTNYRVDKCRLVDMFVHSSHNEAVMVLRRG